ncbi:filamentous hemagglutinin N-terminal domain-containing protein [Morganella morganii]|uniref:two-partner secretion domain-containing protein n=1 Tax=Morganella morganii TaxID=582 RepID=UPI0004685265|nr:filamentous hemagglutinin N-terminal domain-containing protein [Morganella morganii]
MKKNGLLLSMLILSPLSFALANTTDISIVNDVAKLNHNGEQRVITVLEKNNSDLSHIQYDKFNVGSEGVIFNNHIGADTIVNEVISQSASELNGEVHIEGKEAKFTLVNPNGIVCQSGCSFSNTTSVNLTVGIEELSEDHIVGRSAGNSKLTIKNIKNKIAEKLRISSKNIEITNSHVTADHFRFDSISQVTYESPERSNIVIDKPSVIKAGDIDLHLMETDMTNNGRIEGKIRGVSSKSTVVNNGFIVHTDSKPF